MIRVYQLYLPFLGVDLREFFRKQRPTPKSLSPATQLTFLYLLVERDIPDHTVNGLAQPLGYSKMTISRVLTELENAELGRVETNGRNRSLHLVDDRKTVWERAQSRLKTPVTKRFIGERLKYDMAPSTCFDDSWGALANCAVRVCFKCRVI